MLYPSVGRGIKSRAQFIFPTRNCNLGNRFWFLGEYILADKSIWMPIYWGDYFKKTLHFSTFQHGCYILLIAAYWENQGPIPADLESLARICRTSKDKLARFGNPVLAKFSTKNGLLCHERIDFELLRSSARQASAKANGKAGGLAKSKQVTVTVTNTEESKKDISSLRSDIPPREKRKSRSQIPDGFPEQKDQQWSMRYWADHGRIDLTANLSEEVEKFRDHHKGKLTTSADWPASWRTWARHAVQYSKGKSNGQSKPTAHENFALGALQAAQDFASRRSSQG